MKSFLTWLLVQNLLEFGPLILRSLLQEVRPQTLDGEVDHVSLHEPQDAKDLPEKRARGLLLGGFSKKLLLQANLIYIGHLKTKVLYRRMKRTQGGYKKCSYVTEFLWLFQS